MLPADDALVQHERLPGWAVPHPLLLEEDESSLLAAGFARKLKTDQVSLLRANDGVLTKGYEQGVGRAHLDGKQVSPVGLSGLGVHEAALQDEVDLLSRLLSPTKGLQHHLPHPPGGRAQKVNRVVTPPIAGWVDHRDPPPQLGCAGVPRCLLVHTVQPLLYQLPALLECVTIAVAGGGDLQEAGEEKWIASHPLDRHLHIRVNSREWRMPAAECLLDYSMCRIREPGCGFSFRSDYSLC